MLGRGAPKLAAWSDEVSARADEEVRVDAVRCRSFVERATQEPAQHDGFDELHW